MKENKQQTKQYCNQETKQQGKQQQKQVHTTNDFAESWAVLRHSAQFSPKFWIIWLKFKSSTSFADAQSLDQAVHEATN